MLFSGFPNIFIPAVSGIVIPHRRNQARAGDAGLANIAFDGNGSSSKITMNSNPAWGTQANTTIAFRLKWDGDTNGSTTFWYISGRHLLVGRDSGGRFKCRAYTTSGDQPFQSTAIGYADGNWCQIVVTFEQKSPNSEGRIYRDGTDIGGSTSLYNAPLNSPASAPIAAQFVNGDMDRICVYHTVKDPADFGVDKEPPSDYEFLWAGANASGSSVTDPSTNGYDGTLTSMSLTSYTP